MSVLKGVIVNLFALALLGGSACTDVQVHVRLASPSNPLTGLNCKLKRPLTNQHQETNVWCWAASAHTVIEYLKNQPIEQCALLHAVYRSQLDYEWDTWVQNNPDDPSVTLDRPTCCMRMPEEGFPKTGEKNIEFAQNVCYQNSWPEDIFATEDFYTTFDGVQYDWTIPYPHGLRWDQIVEEICADRPMIDVILYSRELGGGGHAVVVGGYSELDDGSQLVHVYDPGYNTEEDDTYVWPYDVYLGNPGVFTHVRNYKRISVQ
jgi:hypothetical protein